MGLTAAKVCDAVDGALSHHRIKNRLIVRSLREVADALGHMSGRHAISEARPTCCPPP